MTKDLRYLPSVKHVFLRERVNKTRKGIGVRAPWEIHSVTSMFHENLILNPCIVLLEEEINFDSDLRNPC